MTFCPRSRLSRRLASPSGLSLAEITVILSVASLLGATLTPAVGDYVNDARLTKAQDDVRVLANAVARFEFDVGLGRAADGTPLDLLVGPGLAPGVGEGGGEAWVRQAEDKAVGLLDDHLVTNLAGHAAPSRGGVVRRGWQGPYLGAPVGADPWGRRYAVNVGLFSEAGRTVLVLSAGRNGVVETAFTSLYPVAGGDDIVALVTSGGI